MIPLTTLQGLSKDQLTELIGDREVYIWGSGPLGRFVLHSLKKSGIFPMGILDGRISQHGKLLFGLPVLDAESVVKDPSSFIVIANIATREAAMEMCNIYCPSCPRGNSDQLRTEGCMSFSTYAMVLDKILTDIPNLVNVELDTWGEPFLNRELPEIIRYTESNVACTVSTNLLITEMIAPVIGANPFRLNITVNGFKDSYEKNMKGASWRVLVANLKELAYQRDLLKSTTETRIVAFNFTSNQQEIDHLKKIGHEFRFPVSFCYEYVNPYEHYLDYSRGQILSNTVHKEIKKQSINIDCLLSFSRREREHPCLCQRIFPIINWDTSVALCHTYLGPVIAETFLTSTWSELLKIRHTAEQCRVCQENGLHRLDIDVLQHKYGRLIG